MRDKLYNLVTSRRFLAMVAGIATVVLHDTLGLPEEDVAKVVGLIGAWILGDAYRKT